jgi:hypothetical protein
MRSEFQEWQDELAGKKPGIIERSSWWLVAFGVVVVALAIRFL